MSHSGEDVVLGLAMQTGEQGVYGTSAYLPPNFAVKPKTALKKKIVASLPRLRLKGPEGKAGLAAQSVTKTPICFQMPSAQ